MTNNVNKAGTDIGLVELAPITKGTQRHANAIEPAAISVGDELDRKAPAVEDPKSTKRLNDKGKGRTPKTRHSK